jgi:hypothetical protein
MTLQFHPYDQSFVDSVRAGGPDANGQAAEHVISDGAGTPCRSCLSHVPKGNGMLIIAARPFPDLQPYAETGPIFLCEDVCQPWSGAGLPPVLTTSADYLLKGYSAQHRIVYGTGKVVPKSDLALYADYLLADPDIAFVDVRSARNNCFQCRISRATPS